MNTTIKGLIKKKTLINKKFDRHNINSYLNRLIHTFIVSKFFLKEHEKPPTKNITPFYVR